ncbi:MAG: HAD-IA family hydrolase [Thermodesulfobacteriota bacterium]|nr:HAD-IA family hydrolase [Thermodesulfobacteriota bacterium]
MNHPLGVKAVLFDFDGTLTKPGSIDFNLIKRAIGCPPESFILEFIETIDDPVLKEKAVSVLESLENKAAKCSEPNHGAEELFLYLRSNGIKTGIISRNSLESIQKSFGNFKTINAADFNVIVTRDDPVKPKPDADGVILAAKKLEVDPKQLVVVGDFLFDIQAGKNAGSITVFLNNGRKHDFPDPESDYTISRLGELKKLIRPLVPLPAGKFPQDLLERFLSHLPCYDQSVLIKPGIGEDISAVDVENEEILVLKSDPITFTTDALGHYAVIINANDIATSGAKPRWLLTTFLFPCGFTASSIYHVLYEVSAVCQKYGITLCGGHTEITDAVTRPVMTGMIAGTVSKHDLIDKKNMKPGDKVLFTKKVAVEGTAIIAGEFNIGLMKLGVTKEELEDCKQFVSSISILKEAEISHRFGHVSAMHDVTEGGLATALDELSIAGGHRLRVDMDKIPLFPQTEKICRLLNIDPLGLIGSGSLLICCDSNIYRDLMREIRNANIHVTCIGEVIEKGRGIEALSNNTPVKWPCFEVDEIARLFSSG